MLLHRKKELLPEHFNMLILGTKILQINLQNIKNKRNQNGKIQYN